MHVLRSGVIPGMSSANERRRYNVTSSLICWAHTENDLCTVNNFHPNNCAWRVICCALLCSSIEWVYLYSSGLLHCHRDNFTIASNAREETLNNVENKAWELLRLHIVTTTKQSTGKPCAYFMGFTDIPHCINENLRVVIMPTSGANNDK